MPTLTSKQATHRNNSLGQQQFAETAHTTTALSNILVWVFFSLLGEDLDGIAQAVWRHVETALKEKSKLDKDEDKILGTNHN